MEERNATNKSCLFYAKFFEFEEFSWPPFFLGSILPQHAVQYLHNLFNQKKVRAIFETEYFFNLLLKNRVLG